MNQNQLDVLDYLVEYTDLLDDTAQAVAEKLLFDGSLNELDTTEHDVYKSIIAPMLSPACEGPTHAGCASQSRVDPEYVLESYQNGHFLCSDCSQLLELREAS